MQEEGDECTASAAWHSLPSELLLIILRMRGAMLANAAVRVQTAWRRYCVFVLVGRFRMLRYLADFREWNPSVQTFLRRARL